MRLVSMAALVLLLLAGAPGRAQTYLGPTPYLSQADSPFAAQITAGTVVLEDFEDGTLPAGVTAPSGSVTGPGGLTDSVDADDGAIDGSGTNGHSFFGDGQTGITFQFDPVVLGAFPQAAGMVWTDGDGTVSFEAFDESGTSLGVQGPFSLPDGSFTGGTAEDRFFGITNPTGVSAIKLTNTSGGIEVDHLQFAVPAQASLDHFLCYKSKPTKGSAPFEPRDVTLADAFETRETEVLRPKALCQAVDKNGEGVGDPAAHLESYQIKSSEKHEKVASFPVVNQLGSLTLATIKEDRLLVPTEAGVLLSRGVMPPAAAIDHFKCYKAKTAKGAPKFPKGVQVTLADAFDPTVRTFDVKKPKHLCLPVDKNGEGIQDASTLLVCYKAKPAKGQPKHAKQPGVSTTNQFGSGALDTVKEEELCIPSTAAATKTIL